MITLYPNQPQKGGYKIQISDVGRVMKVNLLVEFSVTPIAKTNIHQGDNVYFECDITANPATYNVTWRHNLRFRRLIVHTFISFNPGEACR